MENDIADNMSYIVNPVNPTLAICTIRVAINMFLASFTFSFFSSSLYSGFHKNMEITNISKVQLLFKPSTEMLLASFRINMASRIKLLTPIVHILSIAMIILWIMRRKNFS